MSSANEIMRYVRKWHEQIGDMPSKQVGPEVCQIHSEMQHVIHQHDKRVSGRRTTETAGAAPAQ
jgi:hypothetical protein